MAEYIVISHLVTDPDVAVPHKESHRKYMVKLKEEGKLQIGGRFVDGDGGIYILVADSHEEAEKLAKADPYHTNGIRNFTIREWERKL